MKLLTYNFLTSKAIRGVKVGYPLKLHVSVVLELRISKTHIVCHFILVVGRGKKRSGNRVCARIHSKNSSSSRMASSIECSWSGKDHI